MTKFTITCSCKQSHVPFISPANFGADIVEAVYCPKCITTAPANAFHIVVDGAAKKSGEYALIWNDGAAAYYRERAGLGNDNGLYDLFGKKKLIFELVNPRTHNVTYDLLGFPAPRVEVQG